MSMLTDLRLGLRSLIKARGFTAAAVLTLGLGMTLCTTAMVVVRAYLLSGMPYPAADRLYWIRYGPEGQAWPRGMEQLDWRSLDDVIEHPIAWDLDAFYLLGGEHPEAIPGAWVTPGFLQGFGIQPAIGRGLDPGAFEPGAANVVLISHRLWQSRFNGDPDVVGRSFTAYVSDRPEEAESFTIVGVMPQRFWHINVYTDIFAPLRAPTFPYMARLRPGVTTEAAASRIGALVRAGASQVPPAFEARIVSAHDAHVATVRPMLRAAAVAAGLVLLIACANVAGLLLVRSARRQREIAVRSALGAGRGAIARMLLSEGMVLGMAAAMLGVLATAAALTWLVPAVQQQIGRSAPGGDVAFTMDARILSLAALVGVLTALLSTLAPLATALRPRLLGALQSGSRTATEGLRSRRIRAALIAMEIAVSLALLAGSSLMFRSVMKLLRTDLGISAGQVLNGGLTMRQNRYPDAAARLAFFDRLTARLGTVPGVESVGLTTSWPMQQPGQVPVEAQDSPAGAGRAAVHAVSADYFASLRIPIVAGRPFARSDRLGSEAVAIVSESLARRLWPGGRPVGSRIVVRETRGQNQEVAVARVVVGVVRDVQQDPADRELADLYVALLQEPSRSAFLLVRTAGAPSSWIAPLRAALRDIDPELALNRPRPLQAIVDEITARPRFLAVLLGSFAAAAALLALVGVYGVVAYAVRQREREIAVRLAIGADPGRVTRLFVRQGSLILAAGIALGLLAAVGAGRLIESQLFDVSPHDPAALGLAAAAFGTAGLLAVWWPSRRAAMTDPAIALRAE